MAKESNLPSALFRAAALCGVLTTLTFSAQPASADMNLNVGKLSSNGMEVRKLTCQLKSGGLFGSMLIVAELAKQKKAFDGCAVGGAAFQAEFTWQAGKATAAKVVASSEPKANDCIVAALKATKAAVVGTCKAILLTGDTAKAESAADKLSKKH